MKNLKIGKNSFAAIFLAILLTSLVLPVLTQPSLAQSTQVITEEDEWKKIKTDVITVLFPADGRKPTFLWWYTKDPEKIYVVKFQGLIEYFTFVEPFYKERYQATAERLHELFISPKWMLLRQEIRETVMNMYRNWHLPYLPFSTCKWTLTEVKNITAPDNKVIGLAFAFKLVKAYLPRFEFAEGNITIRCRFYYEPVEEISVDGVYDYSVGADEMKMDFVVNDWKWNIDLIKPLISTLKEQGIEIPKGKSGLSLWINLASINITRIAEAMWEPDKIELWSTTSHMMVEGRRVFVKRDYTGTEDERPIDISKKLREHFKLQFATEDETLAGFFRFIASAKVANSTGVYMVPVKASYIEAGAHVKLFVGYPYFGNGTLEHDPSIGVEVPETTTPEATTPKYRVEAPSGSQTIPRVLGGLGLPFITPELVIVLVAVVSTIGIVVFAARRKGKIINVVGVG